MAAYNGWKNYETWLAVTWFASDEDDHDYWESRARQVYRSAEEEKHRTREEAAAYQLANLMKEDVQSKTPIEKSCMYRDLLLSAIDEIDFVAVAGAYINSVQYDIEDEEDNLED